MDCVIDRDIEVGNVWCRCNNGRRHSWKQRQYMHRLQAGSLEQIIEFHLQKSILNLAKQSIGRTLQLNIATNSVPLRLD